MATKSEQNPFLSPDEINKLPSGTILDVFEPGRHVAKRFDLWRDERGFDYLQVPDTMTRYAMTRVGLRKDQMRIRVKRGINGTA